MLLVVDVNVVFSALVKKGNSFEVFENNKLFNKFEFIAPEFMASELDKKRDRLLSKTHLSKDELNDSLEFIKKQITFIPSSEFLEKLSEVLELNLKDAPYLALALKYNCGIFSGDKGLKKQTKVKILSPRELLDIFEKV
ncbi:hypothetical protein HYT23_05705 [Candidatus Pacearchaeota archaeon]|nr:hypothetical protein [Candidatus Pacearchaeota archaeon]